MYACILSHRVCIVMHTKDALHTRLCYFILLLPLSFQKTFHRKISRKHVSCTVKQSKPKITESFPVLLWEVCFLPMEETHFLPHQKWGLQKWPLKYSFRHYLAKEFSYFFGTCSIGMCLSHESHRQYPMNWKTWWLTAHTQPKLSRLCICVV